MGRGVWLSSSFDAEFTQLSAHKAKDFSAFLSDGVGTWSFGACGWISAGCQPAVSLHAFEHRVESAWADVVAVVAQFSQHQVADEFSFGSVVEYMHFPEGKEDFMIDEFDVRDLVTSCVAVKTRGGSVKNCPFCWNER